MIEFDDLKLEQRQLRSDTKKPNVKKSEKKNRDDTENRSQDQCPQEKKISKQQEEKTTGCFHCGATDHQVAQCPKKKREAKEAHAVRCVGPCNMEHHCSCCQVTSRLPQLTPPLCSKCKILKYEPRCIVQVEGAKGLAAIRDTGATEICVPACYILSDAYLKGTVNITGYDGKKNIPKTC